jgi:hypothetical protein
MCLPSTPNRMKSCATSCIVARRVPVLTKTCITHRFNVARFEALHVGCKLRREACPSGNLFPLFAQGALFQCQGRSFREENTVKTIRRCKNSIFEQLTSAQSNPVQEPRAGCPIFTARFCGWAFAQRANRLCSHVPLTSRTCTHQSKLEQPTTAQTEIPSASRNPRLLNWKDALKALREVDVLLGDSPYYP